MWGSGGAVWTGPDLNWPWYWFISGVRSHTLPRNDTHRSSAVLWAATSAGVKILGLSAILKQTRPPPCSVYNHHGNKKQGAGLLVSALTRHTFNEELSLTVMLKEKMYLIIYVMIQLLVLMKSYWHVIPRGYKTFIHLKRRFKPRFQLHNTFIFSHALNHIKKIKI